MRCAVTGIALFGKLDSARARVCKGNEASARRGGGDSARADGALAEDRRSGVDGAVLARIEGVRQHTLERCRCWTSAR